MRNIGRSKVIHVEPKMSSKVNVHVLEPGVPVFRALFTFRKEPLVVKGQLSTWTQSSQWTPKELCKILGNTTTVFKVCARRGTPAFQRQFREKEVVFETQCIYELATFENFYEWLSSSWQDDRESTKPASPKRLKVDPSLDDDSAIGTPPSMPLKGTSLPFEDTSSACSAEQATNPLMNYDRTDYWIYADYKYMVHLFKDWPDLLSSINWSVVGVTDRDGKDSTLWIGSEGANTPCHYDTYGCNFVAQLHGRKKWTLFSPSDSVRLYPTRVPYEESSVFSQVDVSNPDLTKYPLFREATAYEVRVVPRTSLRNYQ